MDVRVRSYLTLYSQRRVFQLGQDETKAAICLQFSLSAHRSEVRAFRFKRSKRYLNLHHEEPDYKDRQITRTSPPDRTSVQFSELAH